MAGERLTDADYRRLLDLRDGLRRFLRWSAEQAKAAGLTPAQHQFLLAVRGHGDPRGPTVGDVADHLLVRHHSAVELADRSEAAGLITRLRDRADGRVVRFRLTPLGARRLVRLSAMHTFELRRLAPQLLALADGVDPNVLSDRRAPSRD